MVKKKLSNIAPFGLRMQPDLRARVEAAAKARKESVNTEIIDRLEDSFKARHDLTMYSDGELIDELIKRWGRDAVFIRLGKEE